MKIKLIHKYNDIISVDNLLLAWQEFVKGKRNKKDVAQFSLHLTDNIFVLHDDLASFKYKHGQYQAFNIFDPKPRHIHKASVRDRVVHKAIYRILYPFFDKTFIADSYSCRINKGTHKAIKRFGSFGYKASKNDTKTVWILKGDIRKFFENIDHNILLNILKEYIPDQDIIWLLENIIKSFNAKRDGVGLPLGNLTSQLLVNIYMNKFDQFIKHKLKIEYYIRYADDFVIFDEDKKKLESLVSTISDFLFKELRLELHPKKVFVKTLNSGTDFLGWVNFFDHRVLRTKTKKRMLKGLSTSNDSHVIQSYLGLLRFGNCFKIRQKIESKHF